MAKIAHLILAHHHARQVSRLANALVYPSHDVYIHVDKKTPVASFDERLRGAPNIQLITHRKRVDWGAYNTVDATLSAIAEIRKLGQYDFFNLLSGTDYPLVKPSIVDDFLNKRPQRSYVEFYCEGSPWWERARTRTEKIHLTNYRFKGKHTLQQLINLFPFRRKLPMGLELVGSSQWFTMTATHMAYVLDYVEKHPAIVRFFKHTWGPDEFFFQTILYNSPFKDDLINDNLRYIDWSESRASPKKLTIGDFEALRGSGKFYARKFEECFDADVLEHIDSILLSTRADN